MNKNLIPSAIFCLLLSCLFPATQAAEEQIISPDGKISITLSDQKALHYRVAMDGKPVLADSALGLEFQNNIKLGPTASIEKVLKSQHEGSWENNFGNRRIVPDRYREIRLTLSEKGSPVRTFDLVIRAYNSGVAFRYDLPKSSGLGDFVLTNELTEFHFASDYRCWLGEESPCAESRYPESTLSKIPSLSGDRKRKNQPFLGVLPLLIKAPHCYVAIAESDLLDWAGMFLTGKGTTTIGVTLASRSDGNSLVASTVPRITPWRVLMMSRDAKDLIDNDLVATLASPNKLGDVSWVKPGIAAWDAWWTGVNPSLPQHTGLDARGDTRSHKEYIDFAAEMGWPYQILDWYWYQDDPTKPLPHVDLPEIFAYAKKKDVKLFIWIHSKDLKRVGEDKVLSLIAGWGAVGVKVDFMDSDSQETVQWYAATLETAAKYHLMVDFHGAYKPTGLARTYPNFITQEGVLGNEYNKLPGKKCSPLHTITLPFTRGLLGPMDFTPGGFLNRSAEDFKVMSPAEVMGTRARQLAMTVLYPSPLLVLCDSPVNYRNQPGVEFFRDLPTVWDETVVLTAEVGKSLALARRSGRRWYLVAMNDEQPMTLQAPLHFLGEGKWSLRSFSDEPGNAVSSIKEISIPVDANTTHPITLSAAGGFAAILTPIE